MVDKIKLVLSMLLVAAGVAGFYLLADKALVIRILAVIAGVVAAAVLFRTTPLGQQSFGFLVIPLLKQNVLYGQHVKRLCKQH